MSLCEVENDPKEGFVCVWKDAVKAICYTLMVPCYRRCCFWR